MWQSGSTSSATASFPDLELGLKYMSAIIYSGCYGIVLATLSVVSPHFRNLTVETLTHESCS